MFECSASSENETLDVLEFLDSLLDIGTDPDDTENLEFLGTITTDSEEHELQLATLSLASLGTDDTLLVLESRRVSA